MENTLMDTLEISEEEAQAYIDALYAQYPQIKRGWKNNVET